MALTVRTVEYFYVRIKNDPNKAYELLGQLAPGEIDLLAFSAVPFGANHMELTLFPARSSKFIETAAKLGWNVTGPQHAILIQGDDRLGAVADIHKCLSDAGVSIYASTGITDGAGHYGYVIYLKESDYREAAKALKKASITTG